MSPWKSGVAAAGSPWSAGRGSLGFVVVVTLALVSRLAEALGPKNCHLDPPTVQ